VAAAKQQIGGQQAALPDLRIRKDKPEVIETLGHFARLIRVTQKNRVKTERRTGGSECRMPRLSR